MKPHVKVQMTVESIMGLIRSYDALDVSTKDMSSFDKQVAEGVFDALMGEDNLYDAFHDLMDILTEVQDR